MGAEAKKEKEKATKSTPKAADETKAVDIVQARENVATVVRNSATEIAKGLIEGAKAGQLASAKYLFEVAGLYPAAAEQTVTARPEDSLAHILLKRMELPTEPVIREDDQDPAPLSSARREAIQLMSTTAPKGGGTEELHDGSPDEEEEEDREQTSGKSTVQ